MTNYRKTMAQALKEVYLGEDNMDLMKKAAGKGGMQTIKMKDGKLKMDRITASAIMQIYDKVKPDTQKKMAQMINDGKKSGIMKLQSFAMRQVTGFKSEEVVKEGTWALPDTPKQKAALKKLLSKPLKAKDASDKLYDLIGDDQMADDLDDYAEREPNDDVRPMVKSHMKRLGIKEEVDLDELGNKYVMDKGDLAAVQKKLNTMKSPPKLIKDKAGYFHLKYDGGKKQVGPFNTMKDVLGSLNEEVELDEGYAKTS